MGVQQLMADEVCCISFQYTYLKISKPIDHFQQVCVNVMLKCYACTRERTFPVLTFVQSLVQLFLKLGCRQEYSNQGW